MSLVCVVQGGDSSWGADGGGMGPGGHQGRQATQETG